MAGGETSACKLGQPADSHSRCGGCGGVGGCSCRSTHPWSIDTEPVRAPGRRRDRSDSRSDGRRGAGDLAAFEYEPNQRAVPRVAAYCARHRLIRLTQPCSPWESLASRVTADELNPFLATQRMLSGRRASTPRSWHVALERIKSLFEPATWRAFESVWLRSIGPHPRRQKCALDSGPFGLRCQIPGSEADSRKRFETSPREFCWLDLAGSGLGRRPGLNKSVIFVGIGGGLLADCQPPMKERHDRLPVSRNARYVAGGGTVSS